MTETSPASRPPAGAIGAIVLGLCLAVLGYVAALGQAMATAPEGVGPAVALAIIVAGAGLALPGLAVLLVAALVIGKPSPCSPRVEGLVLTGWAQGLSHRTRS